MPDGKIRITLKPNGPARVECTEAEIIRPDGTIENKMGPFSLCRCGASMNKPFCDGAHKTCGFEG